VRPLALSYAYKKPYNLYREKAKVFALNQKGHSRLLGAKFPDGAATGGTMFSLTLK
jgi:hypothetical protein